LPYIKYVVDTTILSLSVNRDDSSLQAAADHLVDCMHHNTLTVNEHKTKEILIFTTKTTVDTSNVSKIFINGKGIESVDHFQLSGVNISSDLS
jgi:hypothetical protein